MPGSDRQNVLLVGAGAREHAYAAKLSTSPYVDRVFVAPGNAGTREVGENVDIDIDAESFDELVSFAREKRALTLVGPEAPLVAGIRDAFDAAGLPLAGPSGEAAKLEGSKIFSAETNRAFGIPQPYFEAFDDLAAALVAVRSGRFKHPVIKADGLAAGKGVALPESSDEAENAVRRMMADRIFGSAGARIVIQERAAGVEFSLTALCDGRNVQYLPLAQDHKRIGEGDTGENTGGMGVYAPLPASMISGEVIRRAQAAIVQPLIEGMARRGTPFQGILFVGVIATADRPLVIEYNVRGGDPEIPALLSLLESDFYLHLKAMVEGTLHSSPMAFRSGSALNIVLASGGYPGSHRTGVEITIPAKIEAGVYHAGTRRGADGVLRTAGGRVITVVATAETLQRARESALRAADAIEFDGKYYRRDIGARAINKR